MTPSFTMGIDIGGAGVRCLLLNTHSLQHFAASRPFTSRPAAGDAWSWELDLPGLMLALHEASLEAMAQASARPQQVSGVAVASMRHSLVLMDGRGEVLLAVPNRDVRAAAEGLELASTHGPLLWERTGRWPLPILLAARLHQVKASDPARFGQADVALSLSDYISWRLCGEQATSSTQAAESLLLSLASRGWDLELTETLGIPARLLPPVLEAGTRLGSLTEAGAALLGLVAGIPLAVAGADTACALLATKTLEVGQAAAVLGTTAPLQQVVASPIKDPAQRVWTGLHLLPDRYVLESNAGPMGDALSWLAEALHPETPRAVARLLAEAGKAPVGAGGLLSTLGASLMNAAQMSLPLGSLSVSHYLGASPGARRGLVSRATVEGLAFAVRANLEQLEVLAGPARLALAGGLSRATLLTELISAVRGESVWLASTSHATALGASLCAAVGAGHYESLPQAAAIQPALLNVRASDGDERLMRRRYPAWRKYLEAQAAAHEVATEVVLETLAEGSAGPEAHTPAPTRPRILVTTDLDSETLAALRGLGEVTNAPYRELMRVLSGPDLVEALKGYEVFITEVDVVDAAALAELPELRVVASCRGNAVNVDPVACSALGIPVLYAPGRNAEAVAELTIAFMIMGARKLVAANAFLREPGGEAGDLARMGLAHETFLGRELWGLTVGLVGLGAVGRAVARRLVPFGTRILASDPTLSLEDAELLGVEPCSLEALLAQADMVSLHAAVTDQTRGLLNRQSLARMKPGSFLVNTARAALVDEDALLEALRSGHLAGAALDVFAVEPPASDHPLLALPQVIATLHVGGNTLEVGRHQGQIILADLQRLLRGQAPRHLLNPDALSRFSWQGPRETLDEAALAALAARPAPSVSDLDAGKRSPTPPSSAQSSRASQSPAPPRPVQAQASAPVASATAPETIPEASRLKRLFSARGLEGLKQLSRKVGLSEERVKRAAERLRPLLGSAGEVSRGGSADSATGSVGGMSPGVSATPAAVALPPRPDSAALERVLEAFVAEVKADAQLKAFAQGQHIATHYNLADVGLEFWFGFYDGQVEGGLGAPLEPADVRLKMKAEVMDGIFTGQINPTRAAMTGKLSFTGEVRRAMELQRINPDINRLYNVARDACGGPGDLNALSLAMVAWQEAVKAGASAATVVGTGQTAAVSGATYSPGQSGGTAGVAQAVPPRPLTEVERLKLELVRTVEELYTTGLITATGGNVSARLPGGQEAFITPSQMFKGDLRPESLVRVSLAGNPLDADALAPSSERLMHTAIMKTRPEVEAVVHAHAPKATTLALAGLPFLPISTEAAFLRELPVVPFIMPGTEELAEAVVSALGDGPAVLLQNHGLLVAASSLRRAADLVEIIERTAELILACHQLGRQPPVLPEATVQNLRELGRMMA